MFNKLAAPACVAALIGVVVAPSLAWSQEADLMQDVQKMQKMQQQMGTMKSAAPAAAQPSKEGLKRRDMKGQAMQAPAGQAEGLTPEQQKMMEEIQQQLNQIKENKAKQDAALEQMMKDAYR